MDILTLEACEDGGSEVVDDTANEDSPPIGSVASVADSEMLDLDQLVERLEIPLCDGAEALQKIAATLETMLHIYKKSMTPAVRGSVSTSVGTSRK